MAAQRALSDAIAAQNSQNWPQVIYHCQELLRFIKAVHLQAQLPASPKVHRTVHVRTDGHIMGHHYNSEAFPTLVFETHFYLGRAYERVNDFPKALQHLSEAVSVAVRPVTGCSVGCVVPKILQSPAYLARACLHARLGNLDASLGDISTAIIMDPDNPDILCIRALLYRARKNPLRAVEEANSILQSRPKHVCALIIRGLSLRDMESQLNPLLVVATPIDI
eukprot:m.137468 g.137468  ORF g.137468 m.137468 type:complete len:222 (-) comp23994_c0_seq1:1201-1866(-)